MDLRSATLWDVFCAATARRPDVVLLRTGDGDLTYEQAAERASRIAGGLASRGVTAGRRVVLVANNRQETILLWLACLQIGAVFTPLNVGFTLSQLAGLLRVIDPAAAVAERSLAPALGQALAHAGSRIPVIQLGEADAGADWMSLERSPGYSGDSNGAAADLAAVLCTSGTTGPSKPVALSHRWFTKLCENTQRYWGFGPGDIFYCPLPLYHMDALAMTVAPAMHHGTTAAIGRRFSVRGFWEEVRRFDATVFDFLGSTLTLLWKAERRPNDGNNPARLAWGVPLPEFAAAFEERFGLTLVDCYGSTDVGIPAYSEPGRRGPPGSCGQVADGYEVAILSDRGDVLQPLRLGEIAVRPAEPHVILEAYLGMPDATVEAWRGLWHHTGDAGRIDPEGNLYFEGRLADVIRRRGENVSAQELEGMILAHPHIADVAAIGVPSELTEDEIKVIVVPRDGLTVDPSELAKWMSARLPRFMQVRYIEVACALPRTETQKVQKTDLRNQWRTEATWDTDHSVMLAADPQAKRE